MMHLTSTNISDASSGRAVVPHSAQTAPGGADQNVVGALRLRGALHREALQGALQLVMERHDALRTGFATAADGSLEQVRLC